MKKILITGISGFAGSFLAERLISQGFLVYGTVLTGSSSKNISHIQKDLTLFPVNLLDKTEVEKIIFNVKPDEIYHLAALTSPSRSFDDPSETITNNVNAEINIFEAVRKNNLYNCRILIISSAEVYGLILEKDLPINEKNLFMPTSPYAVSKITQDFLGLQYFLSSKLQIIRARPFNHIGPRQLPQFVVARFASQIADIEKNKIPPIIKVGNLSVKRDFTDVRDMVNAYQLLLEKGITGEAYNIGSGISYSIEQVLQKLLALSSKKITIEKDPSVTRAIDNQNLICDSIKIKSATAWVPKISLDTTLNDTLDYWRSIV